MNTSVILLQKRYGKSINGSFHGIWSLGGFCCIVSATSIMYYDFSIIVHLVSVFLFAPIISLAAAIFVLNNDHEAAGNKLYFDKPDNFILYTGQVVFCAAVCEGGIYD